MKHRSTRFGLALSLALSLPSMTGCAADARSSESSKGGTVTQGGALNFHCSVVGEKFIQPRTDAATICGHFRSALSAALGHSLTQRPATPDRTAQRGDWISATITVEKNGVATAKSDEMVQGKINSHPAISIAVSGRAPGLDSIERLAKRTAENITAAR